MVSPLRGGIDPVLAMRRSTSSSKRLFGDGSDRVNVADGIVPDLIGRAKSDVVDPGTFAGKVFARRGNVLTPYSRSAKSKEVFPDTIGVARPLSTAGFLGTGGGTSFLTGVPANWWDDISEDFEAIEGVRNVDPVGRLGSDGGCSSCVELELADGMNLSLWGKGGGGRARDTAPRGPGKEEDPDGDTLGAWSVLFCALLWPCICSGRAQSGMFDGVNGFESRSGFGIMPSIGGRSFDVAG